MQLYTRGANKAINHRSFGIEHGTGIDCLTVMVNEMRSYITFGLLLGMMYFLLVPGLSYSKNLNLHSISIRGSISEDTVLGQDAPEGFKEYDVSANFRLPWNRYSESGWGVGASLMASAGVLSGAGEDALVVSVIPELILGSEDGRYSLNFGAGAALFSRYRFGTQDYGGAFQFALTMKAGIPLYKNLGLAYRFLHYSDAGIHGSHTIGADLHMIELSYRL